MRVNDDTNTSGAGLAPPKNGFSVDRSRFDLGTGDVSEQFGATLVNQPYRAAVVGTGFMGDVHARAIAVSGGVVGAVLSSTAEKTRRAADRMRLPAGESFEAVLADPAITVVHVCTPNATHHDFAAAALAAGKHVVCEKPLATSVVDARSLVEASDRTGLVGAVPFVYRFHPMVREARQRVREGGIGRVFLTHGSYLQDWLLHSTENNWRVDPANGGPSRAFADIGSHWVDLAEFVAGDRIAAVSAQTSTVNPLRGETSVSTEDIVVLQFRTAAGVVGSTVISQVSAGRKNRLVLEVSGSTGTLTFDQEQPEKLWYGLRGESRSLVRDPATLGTDAARYARVPAGHAQGYQDCFDHFVGDVAAAVRGEDVDGLPSFTDGLRATVVAEAVLASARDGGWVEVSS